MKKVLPLLVHLAKCVRFIKQSGFILLDRKIIDGQKQHR